MSKRSVIVLILSLFLISLAFSTAIAAKKPASQKDWDTKRVSKNLTGGEEVDLSRVMSGSFLGASMAPGSQMGHTFYDYQHNGTMGRQVAFEAGTNGYVHFVWMKQTDPAAEPPEKRKVAYNAYNLANDTWAKGGGAGGGLSFPATQEEIGGYTTMDITSAGNAVIAFHGGQNEDLYATKASIDATSPLGLHDWKIAPGPLTCEGWVTGAYEQDSKYIWPVVAWQDSAAVNIMHVISCESPPDVASAGEIQTLVYYRTDGGTGSFPTSCGHAIDSVYNIAPVVRVDRSGTNPLYHLAIVWLKPVWYDGDNTDPCGYTQWQNDVVYVTSNDYGKTWSSITNITDYTQGETISPETLADGMAYTDLSALFDSDGVLHVVWTTALHDVNGSNPCAPEDQARMWHWDSFNQCISIVYDASRPTQDVKPGAWNLTAAKMNISECDDKLYVSFTRFGAHTDPSGNSSVDNSASPNLYTNGEIFLTASVDGGLTWGQAQNLTETTSPDCAAGDCESDHWSSMAMYSTDSVHIQYINDRDAGGSVQDEGIQVEDPVMYISVPCYTPATYCDVGYSPIAVGYPTWIAPDGSTGCTGDYTTSFTVTLTNIGMETTNYSIHSNASWLTPIDVGPTEIKAGCNNTGSVEYTIGPIATQGYYKTTLDITACGSLLASIDVEVWVFCDFYIPEYEILSTSCWSVGVWNVARAGIGSRAEEGNMYWPLDELEFMHDESVIITMADDTTDTQFSIFDGSDSDVMLRGQGPLTTTTFATYEYAHGLFSNQDTTILGEAEYFLPIHPDTCVLIERIKICNGSDVPVTIHIGEGIDWDVSDGADGSNNQAGKDESLNLLYQYGTPGVPQENYYAGASICHDNPGGIILQNDEWIYNNSGYKPAEVGGLIARHTGWEADGYDPTPDSLEDLSSLFVIAQNVTLQPEECYVFCKVKASTISGEADLLALIQKGWAWKTGHELDCPGCELGPECAPGDANGSGAVDIDDVVYLIGYIFSGGPPPVEANCCGDANGSCGVDIDDVVYEIGYIFSGGPAPLDACATCPPF